MNERIREIAKRADVLIDYGDDITVGRYSIGGSTEKMERFAELIVKECVEQVITGPNGPAHYAVEAALRVKKHFGVEQ